MNRVRWNPRSWITLFLLAITAWLLLSSLSLSGVASLMPKVITSGTLVLLLIQLVSELAIPSKNAAGSLTAESTKNPDKVNDPRATGRLLRGILWLALLPCCVWLAGLILGPALYCTAFLRWYSRQSWLLCAGYSGIVAIVLAAVFFILLKTVPYQGLLWGLLK